MVNKYLNIRLVIKLLGFLLFLESLGMLISFLVALIYGGDDVKWIALSIAITVTCGLIFYIIGKKADRKNIGKREGYFFVTFSWIFFSLFGLLPFYLGGYVDTLTDAFFETMSGFTTTGSTILSQIEILPHGILFWRSLTQWLGGMGIILLSLAIMPLLNMGNLHLFAAEVPGPTVDKLQPRIINTARILWLLYVIITLIETVLLTFSGMSLFDAICHSFTSMATGGFSTKDSSIAFWHSSTIEYIITIFMFIAGINFSLIFWATTGKFKKLKYNDEFTWYLFIVVVMSMVLGFGFWNSQNMDISDSIRSALFNVVSFMTTTGYTITTDFVNWAPLLSSILIFVMILGGMSGSTAGGMKVGRVVILFRHSVSELKRVVHPNAVFPVHYNHKALSGNLVFSVMGFMVLYIVLFFAGSAILLSEGIKLDDTVVAVITCLSNVGPGFGQFSQNFSTMPELSKWTCSFLMLAGRLEIISVMILLMPIFWKK